MLAVLLLGHHHLMRAEVANKAKLGGIYPKVSFKARFLDKNFSAGKVDFIMQGVLYSNKDGRFRMESTRIPRKTGNGPEVIEVFDGRYKWVYYPSLKAVIREDPLLSNKNLQKTLGFLPVYVTTKTSKYVGKVQFKGEQVRKYVALAPRKLKKLSPRIDAKREFLIGDTDGIVRATYSYDNKNNLSSQSELSIEAINVSLPESLFSFKLPKGITVQPLRYSSKGTAIERFTIVGTGH